MNSNTKECIHCGETKTINTDFRLQKGKYTNVCRACVNKKKREHYATNREKIKEKRRIHYSENHDKLFAQAQEAARKSHNEAKQTYEALPLNKKHKCENETCENVTEFSKSIYSNKPLKFCCSSCASQGYEIINKDRQFHSRRTLAMLGKLKRSYESGGILVQYFRELYYIYNYRGIYSGSFKPPQLMVKDISKLSKIKVSTLSGMINSNTRTTISINNARNILKSIARQDIKNNTKPYIEKEIENALRVCRKRTKRFIETLEYFMYSSNDFPTDELIEVEKLRTVIKKYISRNPSITERILDTKLGIDKEATKTIMTYAPLYYVNADLVRHICNRLIGNPTNSTTYERQLLVQPVD